MLHWLLEQAAPSGGFDTTEALKQIGIGSLLLVPISAGFWAFFRFVFKPTRQELRDTQLALLKALSDQVARERELSEKIAPLLSMAADVLSRTPERFDRALRQAQTATPQNEVDRRIEQIERTLRDALRDRRTD